jgi:glycyl-tRNA synthetase beta chain
LLERAHGVTAEMVDAVLANRPSSPLDADDRLRALRAFLELPDAAVLTGLNKRIGNILRKAPPDDGRVVQASALSEEAERRLHAAIESLQGSVAADTSARRYGESLRALIALSAPVAAFFDQIMVMDENLERRANRRALLRDAQRLLAMVADLSRLPG